MKSIKSGVTDPLEKAIGNKWAILDRLEERKGKTDLPFCK
jgi:hypothetical protein